jgi:hypothetical protein
MISAHQNDLQTLNLKKKVHFFMKSKFNLNFKRDHA